MAAVAQDLSNKQDVETEWGWNAMKNWWNPSSQQACKKAEENLIKQFLDSKIYKYQSRQIPINYDPEPMSIKQKKLKRSQSLSFFPFRTSTTSATATNYTELKNNNDSNIKKTAKQETNHRQYIHTLTVRVKSDKLQSFKSNASAHMKNDKINSEQQFYHPKLNQQHLNHDGNAIEGKSTSQFMKRTQKQNGSSSYQILQKQLSETETQTLDCIAPIVLAHGYGCGGGYFIPSITKIFDALLCHIDIKQSPVIHVIDWLGNGLSSRPEFECTTTAEAEDWFVDSLEEWRKKMNITKMILSGHSLGGYMCGVYALRYPQNIEHLMLISPVGLPIRPTNSADSLKNYSWKVRTMMKSFGKLWNSGWTPHDIVRMTGPMGKSLMQKGVKKRLFRLEDNNPLKQLVAEYLYHVIAQQGSAEYALNKILQPGAWAYAPLAQRIGKLKQYQTNLKGYRDNEEEKEEKKCDIDVGIVLDCSLKIDFIYGETDWMTSGHAVKLKQDNVIKCDVYVNPDCGHHLVLENCDGFGKLFGGIIVKGQMLLD